MTPGQNPAPATYAESWNPADLRPVAPLSEDNARLFHDNGADYVVFTGDPDNPAAVIEVELSRNTIDVYFPDSRYQRLAMWYEFQRIDEGTLYLMTMTRWFYRTPGPHGPADSDFSDRWLFRPNGKAREEFYDASTGTTTVADLDDFDSTSAPFFEPLPAFGDWSSITRPDRTLNLPADRQD